MTTILIVDDSSTMRRMAIASLRGLGGVTFVEAGNGLEAIEQLALTPISAVVLDLNMPDMHGLEVLEFMRAHRAYQAIPVIVLTTRGDSTSRATAVAAGAKDYLTKPFSPAVLASRVRAQLSGQGDAVHAAISLPSSARPGG